MSSAMPEQNFRCRCTEIGRSLAVEAAKIQRSGKFNAWTQTQGKLLGEDSLTSAPHTFEVGPALGQCAVSPSIVPKALDDNKDG